MVATSESASEGASVAVPDALEDAGWLHPWLAAINPASNDEAIRNKRNVLLVVGSGRME